MQTLQQYNDSKNGFSSHIKLKDKKPKLKEIPSDKLQSTDRYKDKKGEIRKRIDLLYYLKYISPTFSISELTEIDGEIGRTITTRLNLYDSFRSICQFSPDSKTYIVYQDYFKKLCNNRQELLPREDFLTSYISMDEVPNSVKNPYYFNQYMQKFTQAVSQRIYAIHSKNQEESINHSSSSNYSIPYDTTFPRHPDSVAMEKEK